MKPFFSIIIPYHNSKDTIGPLLESIYSSKHAPPLEVIIVDDGSKELLQKTSFKRHFLLKLNICILRLSVNKGPAVARNRGAEAAKGKFLVFLDSDVVLLPDALSNLSKKCIKKRLVFRLTMCRSTIPPWEFSSVSCGFRVIAKPQIPRTFGSRPLWKLPFFLEDYR